MSATAIETKMPETDCFDAAAPEAATQDHAVFAINTEAWETNTEAFEITGGFVGGDTPDIFCHGFKGKTGKRKGFYDRGGGATRGKTKKTKGNTRGKKRNKKN